MNTSKHLRKPRCMACGRYISNPPLVGRPREYCDEACKHHLHARRARRETLRRGQGQGSYVLVLEHHVVTDLLSRGYPVWNGVGRAFPTQLATYDGQRLRALTVTENRYYSSPYDVLAVVFPDGRVTYRGFDGCTGDPDPEPEPRKTEGGAAFATPPSGVTVADGDVENANDEG